jgi:hypothetical protein
MGAWGAAVFSDDTASDIRGEYRELLEDQVADDEATRRIINSYRHLDRDEAHVLWLALAATQFQLGRLDEDVKARAIEVIDSGRGLGLWVEAGPRELAKRKAVLNKLREQLTGPQRPRKVVRRPWRDVTELAPGAVLAFAASNGEMALFRVARVDDNRVGVAPIVERLDWHGRAVPDAQVLARIPACGYEIGPGWASPARDLSGRTAPQEGPWMGGEGVRSRCDCPAERWRSADTSLGLYGVDRASQKCRTGADPVERQRPDLNDLSSA